MGEGEEVFLGPKVSFASASAARQPARAAGNDDRNVNIPGEELKSTRERGERWDRDARRRLGREKEADKTRDEVGYSNGYKDLHDTRSKTKFRRDEDTEGGETRTTWARARAFPDRNEDDAEVGGRRFGPAKSRFEQSWIRDPHQNKDTEEMQNMNTDRSWRDKDRSESRAWTNDHKAESSPGWMEKEAHGVGQNMFGHTQEDFQKWKDGMKAGSSANDVSQSSVVAKQPEYNFESLSSAKPAAVVMDVAIPIFGALGEINSDEKKPENKPSRMKTSRFTNLFATQKQEQSPIETLQGLPPVINSPAALGGPLVQTSAEDQEGFQRMMAMLRFGGSSAPTLVERGPFPEGTLNNNDQLPGQTVTPWVESIDASKQRHVATHGSLAQPSQELKSQPVPDTQRPRPSSATRPELQSRESDLLLKLIQQPRTPFEEGQIYGQTYNRKDSPDISQLLNSISAKPISQPRAPPPGFFSGPFQGHPDLQSRPLAENLARRDPSNYSEDISHSVSKHGREDFQRQQHAHSEAQFRFGQTPSHFDQHSAQPFSNSRAPSQQSPHDFVPPPPGFSAQRLPAPPGFFQYPSGNSSTGIPPQLGHGLSAGTSGSHAHPVQQGRASAPQQSSFFTSPGFQPSGQPSSGNGHLQQRMLQQQLQHPQSLPQNYDVSSTSDAARRAQREAQAQAQARSQQQQHHHHQQYAQYLKQSLSGYPGM